MGGWEEKGETLSGVRGNMTQHIDLSLVGTSRGRRVWRKRMKKRDERERERKGERTK